MIHLSKSLRWRVTIGALACTLLCAFLLRTDGIRGLTAAAETAAKRELPIYSVARDDNKVALTFDAAWGNEDTQTLIDILARYQVPATFFVVGQWVEKYPESVKALADAGHDIMNHSAAHPDCTTLSAEALVQEIESCNAKIEAITGVRPTLFRPPYGAYNNTVVTTVRSLGMQTIQWDVDSLDWKNPGSEAIVRRVVEKAGSGSICLFHNAAVHTPEALPKVIEGLQARGFTFCKVTELIYEGDCAIDHEGRQQQPV